MAGVGEEGSVHVGRKGIFFGAPEEVSGEVGEDDRGGSLFFKERTQPAYGSGVMVSLAVGETL